MLLPGYHGVLRPFIEGALYPTVLDGLTAYFAYSVARRLSEDYTGPLLRVRRASDNTELDIGYTATNEVDKSAITAHCGASVGYVVTLYDQSGNGRHMQQPTASNQPSVYNGSSLLTSGTNARLYAQLDGTNDSWTHQDTGDPPGVPSWSLLNFGIYAVGAAGSPTSSQPLFAVRSSSTLANINVIMETEAATRKLQNRLVTTGGTTLTSKSSTLISATANVPFLGYVDYLAPASLSPSMDATVDGESASATNVSGIPKTGYPASIGVDTYAGVLWSGRFQELFGFTARQATHTDIKENINDFYALY